MTRNYINYGRSIQSIALPNKFSLRRYYRQSIALAQNQSSKVAFAGILRGIKMRSLT
ncbi:MAG: hypothetical protein KME17_01580 [Cyanosarcina radialis HA8281-LM2]|nr:hypothetical protein [Cyanosarcina radialis HA8281-LM2]